MPRKPELFVMIEKTDTLLGLLRQKKVVDFSRFKEVRGDRKKLSVAAVNFLKRQKNG